MNEVPGMERIAGWVKRWVDSLFLRKAGNQMLSGNLTVNGDLTIPDKIIHAGDTNTAIRFPANDNVSIETSGTERLRIDSSGDVGVNVAPSTAAQVAVASGAASRVGLRVHAAPSQTAALQEWRDSSGNRLARIGATGGLQSSFVNIADDAVATIYTNAVSGVLVFWLTGTTAGAQAGSVVLVRSGATGPHAVLLANGTAVEVTTSDVTGTTGTDGKYTISATATALKIENRLGGTRTFNWLLIS